jgi:hypothetical protein
VKAIVNEHVDRGDIGKKFRQETSSVTNHKSPTGTQALRYDPAKRLAGWKILGIV